MTSTTQKALFVNEPGKPLVAGMRPIPVPKAGEILIKIAATMLLPHDTYGRDWGLFISDKLPFILGSNVAGTIVQLSPDVTAFNVGDSVFGLSDVMAPTPDQAGLQEYAVLSADAVAKTPAGFSHEQVATLPINVVTAFEALFAPEGQGLGFPAPVSKEAAAYDYSAQTLVILGAGASNGRLAIQLAALAGIGNIIAVAGLGSKDELLAIGATNVVDRRLSAAELAKEVHSLVGEDGVTHLYHSHGMTFDLDIALLPRNKESHLISVHPLEGESVERLGAERPLTKAAMIEASNAILEPHTRAFWDAVPKWLGERKLRPGNFRVVDGLDKMEEIEEALDGYREGAAGGAQVVVRV